MPVTNDERRAVYLERKRKGLCPRCGARIKKKGKFVFCDDCRAFFRNYNENNSENSNRIRKARYDERKENNQCPRCGRNLGKRYKKTICLICLEKQYKYNYRKSRPKKK